MTKQPLFTMLLTLLTVFHYVPAAGQPVRPYRFEVDAGAGVLQLPAPYRTGYLYRQQLTGYVAPRLGVALGLNWGSSANLDPLKTRNPVDPVFRNDQPDPAQLKNFYQRNEQMTDLSVVVVPVLTRRHQLNVQVGLSAYRRRETRVDTLIYVYQDPRIPDYDIVPAQTTTLRAVPMAAVGYNYRLAERWAVGAVATTYLTGGPPTTTFALRGAYRFNLPADSLGMRPVHWRAATWGVRAAGNVVAENGRSVNGLYRLRFNGGIWAELPLSLTWQLRGEVNYAQRGYRAQEIRRGSTRYLSAFANANYVELPLLFQHEVAYRWRLYIGPYLAFFLNGYRESDGKRQPAPRPHTFTGLMLGTSYNLTDRLALDARYQRDLLRISTTPYGGFHSFQVGLDYAFKKRP